MPAGGPTAPALWEPGAWRMPCPLSCPPRPPGLCIPPPRGGRAGWGLGVCLAPTGSGGFVFLSCSLARTQRCLGSPRLPLPSSFCMAESSQG